MKPLQHVNSLFQKNRRGRQIMSAYRADLGTPAQPVRPCSFSRADRLSDQWVKTAIFAPKSSYFPRLRRPAGYETVRSPLPFRGAPGVFFFVGHLVNHAKL